jgi:hypothetical protein
MEENTNQNANQSDGGAWKSELPEADRGHEAFAPFKSKSELWEGVKKLHTDYKATAQKATDLEGKMKDYIPRLPENASDEDRNTFYKALGRPEKPEEYELEGADKNSPEWNKMVKDSLFRMNMPKDMAKDASKFWNSTIQKMVETHNANVQKEIQGAAEKLKGELGDKYDAGVELAKRMWTKHSEGFPEEAKDFDKAFTGETSASRYAMTRFLLNIAKLTGEDTSLTGVTGGPTKGEAGANSWFPNSPKSPTGK